MAFMVDKEEVRRGVVIFRRTDVQHRLWYGRIKLPKADRYKTKCLETADITSARERALDLESEVRFQLKHDVPVFNRPFSEVAKEWVAVQEQRAKRGEVSPKRVEKLRSVIGGVLNDYCGSTQVHLIGQETWDSYPAWRRVNGAGRNARNGVRAVSDDEAKKLVAKEKASREKAMHSRGFTRLKPSDAAVKIDTTAVPLISDSTIRFEMSIFGAVMGYAIKKRFVPASQKFDKKPKLKVMRRDEFTRNEYDSLHNSARTWVKAATKPSSTWYRTVAYNFMLIMTNTGMRPSEARNLRWRDVSTALDRDKREIVVLFVQGKGKSRKLVAPKSVGDYLERIKEATREYARVTAKDGEPPRKIEFRPDAPVFSTITGASAKTLYQHLVEDMLKAAKLRDGPTGIPRSTYCFRHTYATFRLSEGVDVYFLAEQMGTSVKMIEEHYGHVNTIAHADRVLQGIPDWEKNGQSPPGTPAQETPPDKAAATPKAKRGKARKPIDNQTGKAKARASQPKPGRRRTS